MVLGAGASRLDKLLPPTMRQALGFRELRIFRARAWREGMGGSLRDGLRALPQGYRQVLVLLVDQTGIRADDLRRLVRASDTRRVAATTTLGGMPMAPAVLPRGRVGSAIASLQGDRGLGPWLRLQAAPQLACIPCPAVLQDLDTPADAAAWRAQQR